MKRSEPHGPLRLIDPGRAIGRPAGDTGGVCAGATWWRPRRIAPGSCSGTPAPGLGGAVRVGGASDASPWHRESPGTGAPRPARPDAKRRGRWTGCAVRARVLMGGKHPKPEQVRYLVRPGDKEPMPAGGEVHVFAWQQACLGSCDDARRTLALQYHFLQAVLGGYKENVYTVKGSRDGARRTLRRRTVGPRSTAAPLLFKGKLVCAIRKAVLGGYQSKYTLSKAGALHCALQQHFF